jgi:hypothetical protein
MDRFQEMMSKHRTSTRHAASVYLPGMVVSQIFNLELLDEKTPRG